MDDLLKKLNVLVKVALRDIVSGEPAPQKSSTGAPPVNSWKDAELQIKTLRQRIDGTLVFEVEIQDRIQALQSQVDHWNQAADDALVSGDEMSARYAVDQMNRAQQSLKMAQSDLHQHQIVTEELIANVNALEAAFENSEQNELKKNDRLAVQLGAIGQTISNTLEEMRDRIVQLSSQPTLESQHPLGDRVSIDNPKVEDDLERRRQRLSKPK
ncbi:MAG: hypothetical protein R3E39_05345 [Anaerolineae bacterium]